MNILVFKRLRGFQAERHCVSTPLPSGFPAKMRISLAARAAHRRLPMMEIATLPSRVGLSHRERDFELRFDPREEDSAWTENLSRQTCLHVKHRWFHKALKLNTSPVECAQ